MLLMMAALLIVIERRNPLRAGVYCVVIVMSPTSLSCTC